MNKNLIVISSIIGTLGVGAVCVSAVNQKSTVTIHTQQPVKHIEVGIKTEIPKEAFISKIDVKNTLFKKMTVDEASKLISLTSSPKGEGINSSIEYTLTIKNGEAYKASWKETNTFNIPIKDTKAPTVSIQKQLNVDYGDKLELSDIQKGLKIEDATKTSIKTQLNTINTKKAGVQVLPVTVVDEYNNETKVEVKVKVMPKPAPKVMKTGQTIKKPSNTSNASTHSSSSVSGPWIVDGSVPSSKVSQINQEWNKIPAHIRNQVLSNGWKLYITGYKIEGRYYTGPVGGTIAGVTDYGKKAVYVNYKGSRIKRATIHEIGHVVDGLHGYLSSTAEWKDIFRDERYKMKEHYKVDSHNISDSVEYFAQCFSEYVKFPSSLKSSAPRTYEYLRNHL